MTLSVRSRFEVFKRDAFTCGYCGRTPDDEGVKLEVDHITPRAAGGSDDLTNLVTSCWECNHGKAAKDLGDKAPSLTVAMANTRERALQLDEYRKWQGQLDGVNGSIITRVWDEWIDCFGGDKESHDGTTTWTNDAVGIPKKQTVLRHFDVLEIVDVHDAIHATHSKWAAGGLGNHDVLRYFFGTLKGKRRDKEQQKPIDTGSEDCDGACGYSEGKEMGMWRENTRLKDLFLNHQANGFATYADVVNALWPEDS